MDMGTRSLSSFGGMCYYAVIVRGALAVKRGLVAAGYQELSLSMCDVLRRRSRIEAGVDGVGEIHTPSDPHLFVGFATPR